MYTVKFPPSLTSKFSFENVQVLSPTSSIVASPIYSFTSPSFCMNIRTPLALIFPEALIVREISTVVSPSSNSTNSSLGGLSPSNCGKIERGVNPANFPSQFCTLCPFLGLLKGFASKTLPPGPCKNT